MPTILFTAPYMIPSADRFKPVFDKYGIELIIPDVQERMEEADLLQYAGQFDGTICGDDHYNLRVIEACSPRLKVISKWGTGIDSIDAEACSRYSIKIGRTLNALVWLFFYLHPNRQAFSINEAKHSFILPF
jgi:D-3-phosphoglycerate dehydrogenase